MQLILKYGAVYLSSMFKFIFGPLSGEAGGLGFLETASLTVAGMMTSVLVFSTVGHRARQAWMAHKLRKAKGMPHRKFTPSSRRIVSIYTRFGLPGVAFFTPVVFTPIGGTILAIAFGEPPAKVVPAMLASAVFWAAALTLAVDAVGARVFGM